MLTPEERYDYSAPLYCFSAEDHERRKPNTATRLFVVHLDGSTALDDLERENKNLRHQVNLLRSRLNVALSLVAQLSAQDKPTPEVEL